MRKNLPILKLGEDGREMMVSERMNHLRNKKHLTNVGSIRHCEPFYIAIHQVSLLSHAATVACRLRIDVHDNDDNNDNDNA